MYCILCGIGRKPLLSPQSHPFAFEPSSSSVFHFLPQPPFSLPTPHHTTSPRRHATPTPPPFLDLDHRFLFSVLRPVRLSSASVPLLRGLFLDVSSCSCRPRRLSPSPLANCYTVLVFCFCFLSSSLSPFFLTSDLGLCARLLCSSSSPILYPWFA
ncbi:hypothetical protein RND81_04G055500 [Saponaria officinalis]|uniref:Transmembrane protein n=1 Tax=Saponaria officinalis TaxID=3572 RepID=A0AAW1LCZ6_SAPOF